MENAKSSKRIVVSLFVYWIIQLIVQNIFGITSNSSISVIIKIGLIFFLIVALFKSKNISLLSLAFWLLFAAFAGLSLLLFDGTGNVSNVVYYLFPVLLSFLVFVCNKKTIITQNDFRFFLKLFIATCVFMCVYALLFQFRKIIGFFSLTSAYGNEITSIFISNHEYGMYLTFGIGSILFLLSSAKKRTTRLVYYLILFLFLANLAFTLSRTSILASLILVSIFVLFSNNKKLKILFFSLIFLFLSFFIFSEKFNSIINLMIFKEQADAGRTKMWNYFLATFNNSSLTRKVFGHGYFNIFNQIETVFNHGSMHNAFLEVLLVWGIVGEILLVGLLLSSFKTAVLLSKKDKQYSLFFVALCFASIALMFTNTACLMLSPVDSYLMTLFVIIVPKYVENGLKKNYEIQ